MIRSSSHSIKFANKGKKDKLQRLLADYRKLVQLIIDDLWIRIDHNHLAVAKFIDHKTYADKTTLSAQLVQVAGKQALDMVRSATAHRKKQIYVLRKLQREEKPHRHLQSKIDRQKLVKPDASRVKISFDQRQITFERTKEFIFIVIGCLGERGTKLKIPVKPTTPFVKWSEKGRIKKAIRLSEDRIDLIFDLDRTEISGEHTVGADQGITTCLSLSNGVQTRACLHGHDLTSIQKKLSRRKPGSKAFARAQEHRKNYVNWSLNQLDFKNIKEVRLEKIHDMGRGQRQSRFLKHWSYTLIKNKLNLLGEIEGFSLIEVPNEFRSQRCSACGWVRKANRKGKTFKCNKCEYSHDADLNAASNLMLDLFEVPFWVRSRGMNRHGFYWKSSGIFLEGQEPIVPGALEHFSIEK